MIQIYNPDNTNFSHNGDMTLFPTKCDLKTVLNGSWQMELEHPIDDLGRWKYIIEESVIKAPSFNGDQLFRVKEKEKSDSGVSATLEPIFMDAMNDCFLVDVRPTEKTGQQALDLMTAPNSKYSGESNITKKATAYYQFKNLIEAINGGEDNSFISRWGGEILFDNFRIHIDESIGTDKGIELLYGKNIPADGLTESVDTREVVTRIYPKAYNGYTITNNGYVDSDLINNYPIIKAAVMSFEDVKMRADASEDDEENGVTICDTQAELDAALTQKCKDQFASGLDKPQISISADMVLLQNRKLQVQVGHPAVENWGFRSRLGCANNVKECFKEFFWSAVPQILPRKAVKGICCPEDILIREILNGNSLGDISPKQPIVTLILCSFP